MGASAIKALSLAGFAWFAVRMAILPLGRFWQAAMVLFLLALALFVWTVRLTRKTPLTVAYARDEPALLLKRGPYRYVRHPFYVSYLLFWAGTAAASPGVFPWAVPLVMLLVYWHAARREEAKFAASPLASAYADYRARVGMFLPRLPHPPFRGPGKRGRQDTAGLRPLRKNSAPTTPP